MLPHVSLNAYRSLSVRFAVAALVLAQVSCGSVYDRTTGPVIVRVSGLKVTPQSMVLDKVGDVAQITATIVPANATDQALTWESSDPSVASVDTQGRVTAKASGAGIFITAFTHDGGFQGSVNVTVP